MDKKMRIMSEKPLNAETPVASLQTWITRNAVFFKRNQGQGPDGHSYRQQKACIL